MADNTVQTGADTIATDDVTTLNGSASSGVKVQRVKVTYGDDNTARDVSASFPLPTQLVSSGGLATSSGTISAAVANTPGSAVTASTTAQVVASTALAGNATFHLVTAAFVGTVTFEGSVDGGLNYAPLIAIREDGTGSESSTAISTAAAFIRQYTVALPGLAYFRVRCSAFTSGTLAVLIAPGPTLIEPSPSLAASTATIGTVAQAAITKGTQGATGVTTQDLKDAGRNPVTYYTVIPVQTTATDTLQSLTGTKSGATVTATTTPAVVTTGKTFRIQRFHATYVASAASGYGVVRLRYNTGGVVAITSPVIATIAVGAGTPATANSLGMEEALLPDGLEVPAGAGVGISVQGFAGVTATAVGFVLCGLSGYEY